MSGFLAGPLEGHPGTDRARALLGLDERDELGKEELLGTRLEPECVTQAQIGHQLGI
jgi:hypothetical protein